MAEKMKFCWPFMIQIFITIIALLLLLTQNANVQGMPVLQIKNKVWTIPVQARVVICKPKGSGAQPKKADGPKSGWPLGVAPSPGDAHPTESFDDVKKMMWMRKGWAEVPVGKDKPEQEPTTAATPEQCPP